MAMTVLGKLFLAYDLRDRLSQVSVVTFSTIIKYIAQFESIFYVKVQRLCCVKGERINRCLVVSSFNNLVSSYFSRRHDYAHQNASRVLMVSVLLEVFKNFLRSL